MPPWAQWSRSRGRLNLDRGQVRRAHDHTPRAPESAPTWTVIVATPEVIDAVPFPAGPDRCRGGQERCVERVDVIRTRRVRRHARRRRADRAAGWRWNSGDRGQRVDGGQHAMPSADTPADATLPGRRRWRRRERGRSLPLSRAHAVYARAGIGRPPQRYRRSCRSCWSARPRSPRAVVADLHPRSASRSEARQSRRSTGRAPCRSRAGSAGSAAR